MTEYISENLKTSIYGKYDVVVVGGGPAGCGAGIAAARSGLKTLVIERFGCLGGGWTTGLINPFFDFEHKKGLVGELVGDLKSIGQWGGFWNMSFNYEYMKRILEEKVAEAGAEILYHTTFSRTLTEGKRVIGVVAENIEGRFAYLADTVIDCTGDGSAAASAGCEFELGEEGEDEADSCQPMTLMFLVANIPEKYRDGLMLYEKMNRAYRLAGKILPFKVPYLIPVPGTHFGVIQFTHMYGYHPLLANELTAAMMEGRRQMIEAFECLTTYDEEFRALELVMSASVPGVRESRRIIGEYRISLEDILSGAQFEDAVAKVSFNADIHTKSNHGQRCFAVKPYQIPLRAMIPKGYEGILVAGRCISGSREALASYRVTGNCMQMGEFAACALAEAKKQGMGIRDVKVDFGTLL